MGCWKVQKDEWGGRICKLMNRCSWCDLTMLDYWSQTHQGLLQYFTFLMAWFSMQWVMGAWEESENLEKWMNTTTLLKTGFSGVGWSNEALKWHAAGVLYHQPNERLSLREAWEIIDVNYKIAIKGPKMLSWGLQSGLGVGHTVILLLTQGECGQWGRHWTNNIVDQLCL